MWYWHWMTLLGETFIVNTRTYEGMCYVLESLRRAAGTDWRANAHTLRNTALVRTYSKRLNMRHQCPGCRCCLILLPHWEERAAQKIWYQWMNHNDANRLPIVYDLMNPPQHRLIYRYPIRKHSSIRNENCSIDFIDGDKNGKLDMGAVAKSSFSMEKKLTLHCTTVRLRPFIDTINQSHHKYNAQFSDVRLYCMDGKWIGATQNICLTIPWSIARAMRLTMNLESIDFWCMITERILSLKIYLRTGTTYLRSFSHR